MATTHQALAELAIFPLPDVVLFPGMALPLHVFEPRYVEMTRDVVAGSRMMAIVRLLPGFEADYHGRPPIHPVATAGEVIACQELPGERLAIVIRGTDRISIERELPPARSYRQVVAHALPDQAVDEEATATARAELIAMCEGLAGRLGDDGAALRQIFNRAGTTPALTLGLAASLVHDPDSRQVLLEERDPAARLELLVDHVSELLVRLGPSSSSAN
jgi:Lon protease-like protein